MLKASTVGELRELIKDLPDDVPIITREPDGTLTPTLLYIGKAWGDNYGRWSPALDDDVIGRKWAGEDYAETCYEVLIVE